MPRTARIAPGGMVFHVLNGANNRDDILHKDGDYLAFLRVMRDMREEKPMRILAFCAMPNLWRLRSGMPSVQISWNMRQTGAGGLLGSVDNVLCPRIIRRCLTGH